MPDPPVPSNEAERLLALHGLKVLDTLPESPFDNLVRVAALACGMPISLLSLIDADRQWFKASVGLPGITGTARDRSFCAHAILQDGVLEVPDAALDPRFADNPLVTGEPGIRFYAGAPLYLSEGVRIGTLCVIDREPGQLTPMQRTLLGRLSAIATGMLETHRTAYDLGVSEARFRSFSESSPLGVFATDADGSCTYTNERWQAIFDTTATEALGHGWARTLHPDDKGALFTEWRRNVSLSNDFERVFRLRYDDGTVRHVRAVSRPVLGPDGKTSGHVGSVEDITEQVRQGDALTRSHQLLDAATESGGIGVWEWNVGSAAIRWTPQMFALFGLPVDPFGMSRERWLDRVHPEDRMAVRRVLRTALAGTDLSDTGYRIVRHDGSVRHLCASARLVRDDDGYPTRLMGVTWDVTSLRQLGDELAEQHERLRVTLQSIGDAVITTDAAGCVTWQNPVAERMTGWASAQAIGWPLARVFHVIDEKTRQRIENPVTACMKVDERPGLAGIASLIARDGTERSIEESAAPILDRQGTSLGAVLVFRDVTEQRFRANELAYRATHDSLTGLLNRAEFELRLEGALMRVRADRRDGALLFIDLDRFKLVNDACGHAAGDRLLSQVARLLTGTVRDGDTLARLGGDEFGIVLENGDGAQALRIAQQVCDRVGAYRFTHGEQSFRIGASVGIAPLDDRWSDTAALLQAADMSCYAAKEAGRNRVNEWCDTDRTLLDRQGEKRWVTRLERALDEDRFVLHLQRIEPLEPDGTGLHAEMLIRLRDPDGSLIMPDAFLPAAERFHLATSIDRWVLRHALQALARLVDVMDTELVCVNLSGQSIGDTLFHRDAIAALVAAGEGVCHHLCLEVTETSAVTSPTEAALFIECVRALGVRVALDDFGAGASSFGYLKALKVDMLKIDGQFVENLADDPLNEAAVRCFVEVARVMGLKTVAEFIDDPRILQRVRELGVDFAQGFLLHRPEPVEALIDGSSGVSGLRSEDEPGDQADDGQEQHDEHPDDLRDRAGTAADDLDDRVDIENEDDEAENATANA